MVAEVAELAKMAACGADRLLLQKARSAQSLCSPHHAGPHAKDLTPTQWHSRSFHCLRHIKKLLNTLGGEDTGNCQVYNVHSLAA